MPICIAGYGSLFGRLYFKDDTLLLVLNMGQTAFDCPPFALVPASKMQLRLIIQDYGSGGSKLCLHIGVDVLGTVLLAGTVDVDLTLHSPHLSLFSFGLDDQIRHVAACQVLVVFKEDTHLLSTLGPFDQTFMKKYDGHVNGRTVSTRVMRLVNILDLLASAVGSSIELHHVLAFDEIIDERSDEEQGHVKMCHASQRF